MVGGGERDRLIASMMDLQKKLGTRCVAGESHLNIYGDEEHGFLGSHSRARRDLAEWSIDKLGLSYEARQQTSP